MFKVIIAEQAVLKKQSFIISYRDIFLALYSDIWIFREDLIHDNYISLAKKLSIKIEEIIFDTVEENVFFWRKNAWNEIFSVVRKCEWFYIKILYKEDIEIQEREITNISFYKK